jgi:hypothetical protein
VSFFVKVTIKRPLFQPIRFRRHHDKRAFLRGQGKEFFSIVGFIGDGLIGMKSRIKPRRLDKAFNSLFP